MQNGELGPGQRRFESAHVRHGCGQPLNLGSSSGISDFPLFDFSNGLTGAQHGGSWQHARQRRNATPSSPSVSAKSTWASALPQAPAHSPPGAPRLGARDDHQPQHDGDVVEQFHRLQYHHAERQSVHRIVGLQRVQWHHRGTGEWRRLFLGSSLSAVPPAIRVNSGTASITAPVHLEGNLTVTASDRTSCSSAISKRTFPDRRLGWRATDSWCWAVRADTRAEPWSTRARWSSRTLAGLGAVRA